MSTLYTEESSQILADCQAKLVEIDRKLSQIKGKCRPGKTKHKYSLHTNEDYIILKKETESLESDIQFVKTLLEETNEIESSLPLRLMKKVFPTKIFSSQNKNVSNEIKAKIIAHSTALLEEKVKVLQTIANSKRKKKKPKPESRDSIGTDTSNSIRPQHKLYKPGASSDSEIIMNPEKISSLKVLSTLNKQHITKPTKKNTLIEPADLQVWNADISKYFTPTTNNILRSSVKKTESKTEYNIVTCMEQHVQTMEIYTPKTIYTLEKQVQTDFPLVTWVNSSKYEKINVKKHVEKETNTEPVDNDEVLPNLANTTKPSIKLIQDSDHQDSSYNILDMNEIDGIINSLLCSPLKMLQCKHINKVPERGNLTNPSGYVNLIIRQSDFMPVIVSAVEKRKELFKKSIVAEVVTYFPYIYHVKQITSCVVIKEEEKCNCSTTEEKKINEFLLDQCSSVNYSNKVGKTEYSVQYKNPETNKKSQVSNTLQIDYRNPQTSGRIVLTEFGNSQTSAQSEMISRILTHLIGLPSSQEKK